MELSPLLAVQSMDMPSRQSVQRRLFERLMRLTLAQRALASIRWRSGLDADLAGIVSRIEAEELSSRAEVEALSSRIVAQSKIAEIEQMAWASAEELRSKIEAERGRSRPASFWAEILFHSNWSR